MSPEALNAVYAAIGDCTPMRTDCRPALRRGLLLSGR